MDEIKTATELSCQKIHLYDNQANSILLYRALDVVERSRVLKVGTVIFKLSVNTVELQP